MTGGAHAAYRAIALAFGLLVGCGGDSTSEEPLPHPCAPIACINGLTITLTTPPTTSYRVEAIGPGETTPHGLDCSGIGQCIILFPGYQPVTVTISVITAANTLVYNKTPTYTTTPNSGGCILCRDGVVTVP